ncbi:MAG: flagellar hook-length control protein FliK [Catonella sp.]|uniref:flagellar hook-length control protein FliK n=1 Tax=Catonella sp. TaxID=2382125 RepID=UPI003F9FAE8D
MPIDVSRLPNNSINGRRESAETSRNNEVSRASGTSPALGNINYNTLSKGQVFSGQVKNISPGELTLEFENGQTLTAKYDNSAELSIGDGARFKVINKEDGQITLKTIQTGNNLENVVYRALESSGLPFSPKNEELVTALLKNEYPISRQMINGMLRQSLKNPDISMTNLVLMNKAGLDVNPESTKLFEIYSNGLPELTAATESNFNDMLDMIKGLLSDGNIEESANLASNMLDIFNIGIEPDELVLTLVANNENNPPAAIPNDFTMFLDYLISEETNLPGNDLIPDNTIFTNTNLTKDTAVSYILSEDQRLEIFTLFENAEVDVDASKLQKLIKGDCTVTELSELIKTLPETEQKALTPMTKQIAELFSKELPISNDLLTNLLPETATLSEAAEHIKTLLTTTSVPIEIKEALLKSNDFHKTLKMLIHTDWTLSAEELNEKEAIANLYRRMNEQIDKLKILADNTSGNASAKLSADLGQTKQNMNFMNEMNQMYNFVELPIRMNGQTAAGDLYVYSDKHKKRIGNEDGISCLLHLDMANLGGINIRIDLNGEQVSTRFFLSDDTSGKLIASHLDELDTAMSKQGFNPQSEVVKTTEKEDEKKLKSGEFNLINDFIPSEIDSNNYSRYTFDMRA